MSIPPDTLQPRRKSSVSGDTKFMIIALLIILLGGGAMFLLNKINTPQPDPATPPAAQKEMTAETVNELFTQGRHQKGDIGGADLTIVEFADFECPSCRRAYNDTIKTWDAKLPSHRMAFYNFPLPMHKRALPAAIAAEAAAKQNKFWEMYAPLFSNENKKADDVLDEAKINASAKIAGLDMARFDADRKAAAPLQALIEGDTQVGTDNGVDSTPTFFIRDKAGNIAVLSGGVNLARMLPDLKNGVLGDDKIEAMNPEGQPVIYYIGGKRESR